MTGLRVAYVAVAMLAFGSLLQGVVAAPSDAQMRQFYQDIVNTFPNTDGMGPGMRGGSPSLRILVRLGFHDCASERCDGCIDVNDADNAGLGALINLMDNLYTQKYSAMMSKADMWANAATIAAIETSKSGAHVVSMNMWWGRQDASQCSSWPAGTKEGTFPSALVGATETIEYFRSHFGFTERETVAIMGAHSLGRAGASGFEGPWTANVNRLDNEFYRVLTSPQAGWTQRIVNEDESAKYQWSRPDGNALMLNSDIAMFKDIGTPTSNGQVSCTYSACPASSLAAISAEYASDNALFVQDFGAAFEKMLTKGLNTAQATPSSATESTPAASPTPTSPTPAPSPTTGSTPTAVTTTTASPAVVTSAETVGNVPVTVNRAASAAWLLRPLLAAVLLLAVIM